MKKLFPIFIALFTILAPCAVGAMQNIAPKGGLIPPPAINIPFGGKIVTEINISDDNILGIIKQAIPAFNQAVQESPTKGPETASQISAIMSKADLKGLMDAISGIKSVRILIVQYGRKVPPATFINELNKGIGKTGNFSKVVTDFAQSSPNAFALYAEPNNQGYLGYSYDPHTGILYAGRVVGFVDVPKLTKWGWNLAQVFMSGFGEPPADETSTQPVPAPEAQESPAPVQH